MKGKILDYSIQSGEGLISAQDGKRHLFPGSEWKGNGFPQPGLSVDFEVDENNVAKGVYIESGLDDTQGANRLTAALLAFFLGMFGTHKFYLGMKKQGYIMLAATIVGFATIFPLFVTAVISFVEFVSYLSKSDENFYRIYVVEKKKWF